jgi:hypothetical protein
MRRTVTLLAAASVFVFTTLFGATPLAAAPIGYTVDTALVGSAGIIDHVTGSITTSSALSATATDIFFSFQRMGTFFTASLAFLGPTVPPPSKRGFNLCAVETGFACGEIAVPGVAPLAPTTAEIHRIASQGMAVPGPLVLHWRSRRSA